jgi:putative endonuclease
VAMRIRQSGVFVYTPSAMAIFSSIIFGVLRWKARHGLRDEESRAATSKSVAACKTPATADEAFAERARARRTGVRGETYAYWYLRRLGYVFVARNWSTSVMKGEIDMVGYDGETLAFVEVRTRTLRDELTALPELSVTLGKQQMLVRTAKLFMHERRVKAGPVRFDVVAIDNEIGRAPEVRLHKDAFSPEV